MSLHDLIRKMAKLGKNSHLSKSEVATLARAYRAGKLTANVILEAGIEEIYGFLRPKDLLDGINLLSETFNLKKLSADEMVDIGRSSMTRVVERYLNAFEKEIKRHDRQRKKSKERR